jgi:hypothetical protein
MEITDDKIDDMLDALDDYAREIDMEYGLPCHGYRLEEMRKIVRTILTKEDE